MTDFDPKAEWSEPAPDEIRAIREYFDRRDDRAIMGVPNPLFGGRETLIDDMARDLADLRRADRPINNLTRVLYGAPGAGKSEVLVQLASTFSRWDEGGSPVLPVWADSNALKDPVALGEAVYLAAGRDPDKVMGELVRVEAGGSIGVVRGSVEFERRARGAATALGRVARAINRECGNPTILLLIDEAQKKLADVGDLPLALHEANAQLKVLPVYGGLGDTVRRLAECGLSRLSSWRVHLLGPLDRDAALVICKKGLRALADVTDPRALDRRGRLIVESADAWPMHMAHCLLAVRRHRRGKTALTFDDAAFDQAMRDADKLRADYYDSRLRACPELKLRHYGAWGALFSDDAIKVAPDVADALGIPEDEAEKLLGEALRAGLVESPETHRYTSPIPSLARYTVEIGRAYASGGK